MENLTPLDIAVIRTPALKDACFELVKKVNVAAGQQILRGLTLYLGGLKDGRTAEPSLECGLVLVIALLHIERGTPLHLSNALFYAWIEEGGESSECSAVGCGYRNPGSYRRCILCGTVTGAPGSWSQAQAARAGLN